MPSWDSLRLSSQGRTVSHTLMRLGASVKRRGSPLAISGFLLTAGLFASCSSSSFSSPSPSVNKCGLTLNASAASVDAAGGRLTIEVVTTPECAWTVANDAPWVTEVTPASGQGNGTITVLVMPNGDPVTRTADVRINDRSTSVRQDAACQLNVAPAAIAVIPAGALTSVSVTSQGGCAWNAVTLVPWITLTGTTSGSSSGAVSLSIAANSGASRSGTVSVGGRIVTVTQNAVTDTTCVYTLGSPSQNLSSASGPAAPIGVTAAAGCGWTAVSTAPWITITSGPGASGIGVVTFSVAANSGAPRSGTIVIAGQTFTVNQASPCTYAVAPGSQQMGAGGGAGATINVTAAAGCAWTAVSGSSWLTITSGASGSGASPVTFTAAPNAGPQRSGVLTIAGHTFTVTQANGCAYGVAPVTQTVKIDAGPGTPVLVTTAAGCAWNAQSNDAWITITSGASGSGNGSVAFTVTKGPNKGRTGTLAVASQTVTVHQEGK